jgi:transposase
MNEQTGISYRVDGKRIYTAEFKQTVVEELRSGITAAEVARKYQIPMQNVFKWKSQIKKVKNPEVIKSIPSSAYNEALDEIKRLQVENKKLVKSLSNMTVDRDILKEAVDYATKKKWISPVKLSGKHDLE